MPCPDSPAVDWLRALIFVTQISKIYKKKHRSLDTSVMFDFRLENALDWLLNKGSTRISNCLSAYPRLNWQN